MHINGRAFGMVGHHKRKDTIGLQKALKYIKKHPHVTLYIPEGTYHIGHAVKIYEGATMILHDNATLLRCSKDALLKNGSSKKKYYGHDGNGNIHIEGGTFDMNGDVFPYNNTAMSIGHTRHITIKGVTFKDVVGGHAIDACGIDGLHISGCRFLGFKDVTGKRGFSEAVQLDLHVPGAFPKFGVNDHTITKNVVIEHNYFGPSTNKDFKAWNRGIGSHASRHQKFYENIFIRHNTFEEIGEFGVTPLKCDHLVISDNTFLNCKGGIRYLGVKTGKNAFDGNNVDRGAEAGYFAWFENNRFEGPMVHDAIHCRSYLDAYHKEVYIVNNQFDAENGNITLANVDTGYVVGNRHIQNLKQSYTKDIYVNDEPFRSDQMI